MYERTVFNCFYFNSESARTLLHIVLMHRTFVFVTHFQTQMTIICAILIFLICFYNMHHNNATYRQKYKLIPNNMTFYQTVERKSYSDTTIRNIFNFFFQNAPYLFGYAHYRWVRAHFSKSEPGSFKSEHEIFCIIIAKNHLSSTKCAVENY